MNNSTKKFIILITIVIAIIFTGILLYIFLSPYFIKKVHPRKTINVFGEAGGQSEHTFPGSKPEFNAVIGKIKPTTVHQQSISIYKIGDAKKTAVFTRPFYADGFRGSELTYTFSSGSAEIIQSGILGTLGCKTTDCAFDWTNFYVWDAKQHTFILNNTAHKESFTQLLASYHDIDKRGCSTLGKDVIDGESTMSLSDLYKKFPANSSYCSKTQGILKTNLQFFLQIEKALDSLINGQNVSSNEIRNISI